MAKSFTTITIGESLGFKGGLEQFVFQVASVLKERGHRHVLLYERTTGTDEDRYKTVFEDSAHIPDGGGVDDYRKFLDEICERWRPDVALLHKSRNCRFLEALVARMPTIALIQDHFLYCLRETRYFPVSRKICTRPLSWKCLALGCFMGRPLRYGCLPTFYSLKERRSLLDVHRRMHRVVVLSNHMKSELVLNRFDPDRIDVIPGHTQIPAREFPPVSDDSDIVLFVGQVIRSKGLDMLVKAMTLLRNHARLRVIGVGSALEANKKLANTLDINDRVEFLGWVPHHEIDKHFEDAVLVVVPSVWAEPFCLVGIEAMARSRPVVAFDVGGISQWLEDGKCGYLVREITPEALAARIDEVLGNRDLAREMGAYGRKRAAEEFSPGVAGDRLEQTIIRTINQPKSQNS
ncbi:MAG: hypothetical protein DRP79_01815 [Planctomycetota bacterium]|nr:MAG: hypothetical protein DRP79_01815 [Planctomycetota bacterium]